MTKKELIEYLEDYDDNMEVHISYDYGDYWKTMVAPKITDVDLKMIKYSEYHRMNKIDIDGEDEDVKEVIIIS